MTISVLLSVYNQAKFIGQAIESIINQSFEDWELLVVNDGSRDDTTKVLDSIADSRIKIINNFRNIGLTKSLNIALSQAKGEYIARMDADDISHKDRFANQLGMLKKGNSDLVGAWSIIEDLNIKCKQKWKSVQTAKGLEFSLCWGSPFAHSSIMARRDILDRLRGYNNEFYFSQDYDLYARLVNQGFKIGVVSEFLITHRVHNDNLSFIEKKSQDNFAQNVRERLLIKIGLSREQIGKFNKIISAERCTFFRMMSGLKLNYKIKKLYIKNKSGLTKEERKEIKEVYNERQKALIKYLSVL